MNKLITGCLTLIFIGFSTYTLLFFIADDSRQKLEYITFKDILPSIAWIGKNDKNIQKQVTTLEKQGINTKKGLLEALQGINQITNIHTTDIILGKKKPTQRALFNSTLKRVNITFSYNSQTRFTISAVMIEKSFLNFHQPKLMVVDIVKNNLSGEYDQKAIFQFFKDLFNRTKPSIYLPINTNKNITDFTQNEEAISLCDTFLNAIGSSPDQTIENTDPFSIMTGNIPNQHYKGIDDKIKTLHYMNGLVTFYFSTYSQKYFLSAVKFNSGALPQNLQTIIPNSAKQILDYYGAPDEKDNQHFDYYCSPAGDMLRLFFDNNQQLNKLEYSGFAG